MLFSAAQAVQDVILAAPEPGKVTIDFTQINWFYYTILITIIFVVLGLKGDKGAWKALGIIVVAAVAYALFVTYIVNNIT
jgi:hypothetical protein